MPNYFQWMCISLYLIKVSQRFRNCFNHKKVIAFKNFAGCDKIVNGHLNFIFKLPSFRQMEVEFSQTFHSCSSKPKLYSDNTFLRYPFIFLTYTTPISRCLNVNGQCHIHKDNFEVKKIYQKKVETFQL